MTAQTVTTLQAQMIKDIALNEMTALNGAMPETLSDIADGVWADCVIETKQDKGTFTSLMNAGLVDHSGRGEDAIVGLTKEGFEVFKSLVA